MLGQYKFIALCAVLGIAITGVWAQPKCTTRGQTPYTAFPVCGTTKFSQTTVPGCANNKMPTLCPADGNVYVDLNPFWYKFTCFTGGTLGFIITPNDITDDYDWQLFDITGHDPDDVYKDTSLIVGYNWSGEPGTTGTSGNARSTTECGSTRSGPKIPVYSSMPILKTGHQYLLMVSHFTVTSQSGYDLSFSGGTAVITDPSIPSVQTAYAVCDGTEIVVKLNKKLKCSSVASDGTDFTVTGPVNISVVSASGNGCSNGFDMDSVTLKLNRILSPGTYTVTSQTGTDGNTLVDNCDNNMATGLQATLRFTTSQPTPMDSIVPVACIKDTLQLVFSKPMKCSSIAPDGSDFVINGPVPVTVKSARGICTSGVSTVVQIILSSRILVNGTFQVVLKNGTDGNSLIDECDQVTAAGSSIFFTTKDIATAGFNSSLAMGCTKDTLTLSHNGNNGSSQWQWMIDSLPLSTNRNAVYISNAYGAHTARLTVSNGKCSDTASVPFVFDDHSIKAAFNVSADTACSSDTIRFTNMSSAGAVSWIWDFGNGQYITQKDPGIQKLAAGTRSSDRLVKLIATNSFNCSDTAYKYMYVLLSCDVSVPSAFTPNGDGLNDKLYPLNAYRASNMVFRIYTRGGQVIFESRSQSKKWDGRVNGLLQPSGTYVWTLDYWDMGKKQNVSLSGTTVLIR